MSKVYADQELKYKKGTFKRPASGMDITLDCSQYDAMDNDSTYVKQEPAWEIDHP